MMRVLSAFLRKTFETIKSLDQPHLSFARIFWLGRTAPSCTPRFRIPEIQNPEPGEPDAPTATTRNPPLLTRTSGQSPPRHAQRTFP